jgi:hypothetical protein
VRRKHEETVGSAGNPTGIHPGVKRLRHARSDHHDYNQVDDTNYSDHGDYYRYGYNHYNYYETSYVYGSYHHWFNLHHSYNCYHDDY